MNPFFMIGIGVLFMVFGLSVVLTEGMVITGSSIFVIGLLNFLVGVNGLRRIIWIRK